MATLTHVVWADLTKGKGAFEPFIKGLAKKMEIDGHGGLIGYNVYFDEADDAAVFVITYENADAFLAHHDIISDWEEIPHGMSRSQGTGMACLGPRTPSLNEWISSRPFPFKVDLFDHHAAGFLR